VIEMLIAKILITLGIILITFGVGTANTTNWRCMPGVYFLIGIICSIGSLIAFIWR